MPLNHLLFGRVVGDTDERLALRHDELLGINLLQGLEEPQLTVDEVNRQIEVKMKEAQLTDSLDAAIVLSRTMKTHLDSVVTEVGNFLKGDKVGEQVRTVAEAILTRSHVVLEGASGTGKTVAVTLVARALDMPFERIDALPDLSDLDIIGGEVFEGGQFRLKRSKLLRPIVLMIIDEFGRLSATCANAFLQALEEREVGISDLRASGITRLKLSPGFVVAAAMNPQTYGGGGGINEALFDRISVGLRMPMPNNNGLNTALEEVELALPGGRNTRPEIKKLGLPDGVTLLKIWSAINKVRMPPGLRQAIIDANYLVSPPAYREANGWTECSFTPTNREERATLKTLETETARFLFEGSNPRGMALTVLRAKANAFFRGPTLDKDKKEQLVVNQDDVRRAAEAALLFRLKSYPGTPPAEISKLIKTAVDLAIPKSKGAGE